MPIPLLTAKLFRPVLSSNRVARPHLAQRLDEGLALGCPLTLISAPAGYGKSTLVAEWLAQFQQPAAWLSLDEVDDEPGRFWLYFLAALRQIEPTLGATLFAALESGQLPSAEALVVTMMNEMLAWRGLHVLVLDDFQLIQNRSILEALGSLLAHQLPTLHLVIITREDPLLPLARLRAHGQLSEVRAQDLRFSEAESTKFLCQGMGLKLAPGEVARLTERTEGWAAGLQLVGLSLRGREDPSAFVEALSGSHRFILNYLTDEVLKRQPDDVQNFLLQTSILARLTGSLCDAVTGETGSDARLESLLNANLFILSLDDEGTWYRYHHLFADLLHSHLRRQFPQRLAELHLRASRWYEQEDLALEAIEHALAAGDFARSTALIDRYGWGLLDQGYVRKMESWMQTLPAEWRTLSPNTSLGFGWMYLLRGNYAQAVHHLEQAQAALAQQDAPQLRAEALALQANLMQSKGQVPAALAAATEALQLADTGNGRVRALALLGMGGAYRQAGEFEPAMNALQEAIRLSRNSAQLVTEMLAVSHLTLMSLQYGRLRFAADTALHSIEWMERTNAAPPPIVGAVFGALGRIYYEWDELDKARELFARGIQLGTFTGHTASLIYTKVNLARLLQATGDLEAAARELGEAVELTQAGAPGWVRPDLLACQAGLLLAQQDPQAAERLLQQSGVTPATPITYQTDALHLAWLHLLVHQKQPAALLLADALIHSATAGGRNGTLIQALLLGAQAGGNPDWRFQARALGEPEGYRRVLMDAAASPQQTTLDESRKAGVPDLTERELEVLRLLAEGLTYAEAAERLVVSLNTVRYHVKGIYGKLGVEKQLQAVERGRALGLI